MPLGIPQLSGRCSCAHQRVQIGVRIRDDRLFIFLSTFTDPFVHGLSPPLSYLPFLCCSPIPLAMQPVGEDSRNAQPRQQRSGSPDWAERHLRAPDFPGVQTHLGIWLEEERDPPTPSASLPHRQAPLPDVQQARGLHGSLGISAGSCWPSASSCTPMS